MVAPQQRAVPRRDAVPDAGVEREGLGALVPEGDLPRRRGSILNSLTRYPKGLNFNAWSTGYQPLTSQPQVQFDGLPLTLELGDVIWDGNPAAGTAIGQVCTLAGTQGAPRAIASTTTAAIPANTNQATLADATYFAASQYVTIAGVATVFQITSVNHATNVITLDQNVVAGAPSGVAVTVVTVAQTFAGSQTVSVDTTTNLLVGEYITIAGISAPAVRRITAVHDLMNSIEIDGGDPGNAGPHAVLAFSHPKFATFGGARGTLTVAVNASPQALVSSYETIKLTGTLAGNTILTVPSEDGWSARFLDLTVRNNYTLTVQADTPGGTVYQLPNGQTQRLYIEFDGAVYNVRPECPAALGPVAFNPGTLALTGWWRAPYGGAPWTSTASAGTSGLANRSIVHDANDPTPGATLNSLVSASFNGTNNDLLAQVANNVFFGSTGSFWCLFQASSVPTASGTSYADGTFFTDRGNAETTFGYVSVGGTPKVLATVVSGGVYVRNEVALAFDGKPHLFQVKWDGTNLSIRIDSGAWSSVACGNYGPINPSTVAIGLAYGTLHFAGLIWEMACAATALANTDFDNVLSYVNTRYGLAL